MINTPTKIIYSGNAGILPAMNAQAFKSAAFLDCCRNLCRQDASVPRLNLILLDCLFIARFVLAIISHCQEIFKIQKKAVVLKKQPPLKINLQNFYKLKLKLTNPVAFVA